MSDMLETPAFVIDLDKLEANLRVLQQLKQEANCKIVLALKAFSLWHTFPLIGRYLDGCCASGLHEALLSHEHMKKHTLTYSPAYKPKELEQLLSFSSHIDFNSASQWQRFQKQCLEHPRYKSGRLKLGLRINPEHSTGTTPKYDPCNPNSRLGATQKSLLDINLTGISGLHFHTLCEQYTDDLETTLAAIDHKFGYILTKPEITWLNLGGGHWITKSDYDREKLVKVIKSLKQRYELEDIWLEPGEAVAINTGTLETTVLDIMENGSTKIAILDVSATAHMPDTLEMPYRPDIIDTATNSHAGNDGDKAHTYHIGGLTCLAGDTLGAYSFEHKLTVGDRLTIDDMSHYTMVKTTTFNGVPHPNIVLRKNNMCQLVRKFTYDDFKSRLG